jgi:hypothetical protein
MLKKLLLVASAAVVALVLVVPAFASDGNGGLIANRGGHTFPAN